jgi:hypothetical protein
MKYQKKISVGAFFKKGVDIKEGDVVEITNEGKEVPGEFGMQDVFLIKLSDGREGNVSINQTSINGFIDAFGEDSLQWIGKRVKVWRIKQSVSGKFLDVYYFSHPEAELTENGFVLSSTNQDIPVAKDKDEVNIKDIPF